MDADVVPGTRRAGEGALAPAEPSAGASVAVPGPWSAVWAVRAGLLPIAAVFLWAVWPQLARPYIYDDVNFALAADAVARTGLAFGNQGHMSERWDFSQREQWALWHPPLYIYLLGVQFALFGGGEVSGRLLGVGFGLATAGLVYLVGRRLRRDGERESGRVGDGSAPTLPLSHSPSLEREATGLLAAAFYLWSPLEVQSAQILDIDGTVLTFLLTLFVYVLVRFPPERHPKALFGLGGLFALSLWAKMTTPLGLLGCLLLARLLGGRWRQAARELVVIGLGGGLLFLASWGLACLALRMPFDMPFAVTWIQLLDASESSRGWFRSPLTVAQTMAPGLLWAGPYVGLLFAAAGLARLRRFLLTRRIEHIDLLLGFGALVYFVYLIKLAGFFPKYHVAMLPFWALAAAALVIGVVRSARPAEVGIALGGFALAWGYFAAFVGDGWVADLWPSLVHELALYPGLLVAGLAGALCLVNGRRPGAAAVLALAVVALAWGPGVEARMREAAGSTTYYYGTRGQREAAELVEALTRPDEFYAAAKEVAWYARNRNYLDQDTLEHVARQAGGRFDGRLVGYDVRVLAIWVRPDYLKAFHHAALSPGYDLAAERGDYQIWVRRAQ